MKSPFGLILATVLASSLACAENLTQKNVEKTDALIEVVFEAHGGDISLQSEPGRGTPATNSRRWIR